MNLEAVTLQEQYALLMPRAWFLNTKISINRNQGSSEKGAGGGKWREFTCQVSDNFSKAGSKVVNLWKTGGEASG